MTHATTSHDNQAQGTSPPEPHVEQGRPGRYASCVAWLFTVFSATRLLTYLPTMWAIYADANSSQHSLFTWIGWVGANASMAAWLYESAGRKINKAIVVTVGNCVMCLATTSMIWFFR